LHISALDENQGEKGGITEERQKDKGYQMQWVFLVLRVGAAFMLPLMLLVSAQSLNVG
jgi:hypothetical protein